MRESRGLLADQPCSGAEANHNEQREYRGNKIDLQTNVFHGLITISNVSLLVRRGRDGGGEWTHYPWSA